MNNKLSLLVIALALCACFLSGFLLCKHTQTRNKPTDTIHTIVYDTLHYRTPIAYDSVVVRYAKKYETVTKTINDTVVYNDTISISLPITQKQYRDSTYEAWVSGYEVQLDSINVFSKTVVKTITQPAQKTKRWGIGVNAGYGYTPNGFSPYIGVGLQYNILMW